MGSARDTQGPGSPHSYEGQGHLTQSSSSGLQTVFEVTEWNGASQVLPRVPHPSSRSLWLWRREGSPQGSAAVSVRGPDQAEP